eukprot:Anaeramoba_ignava/c21132_g1_i2.p2 GENE.c21132_g1_i2~~c21132_g1_i2.p2  ORF type:complete len:168 (-),score=37.93 c21132_g1_i2:76-579(-)
MGFTCFLACYILTYYFQWHERFYILITTLKEALPDVIRCILGTLPMFFGFTFMATIFYGSYSLVFSTIDQSAVTLFAVMNGDVIRDSFNRSFRHSNSMAFISRVYEYIFVCIFMYTFLNVFITIVEEARIKADEIRTTQQAKARRQIKRMLSQTRNMVSSSRFDVDS